jgi:hypothetical protein
MQLASIASSVNAEQQLFSMIYVSSSCGLTLLVITDEYYACMRFAITAAAAQELEAEQATHTAAAAEAAKLRAAAAARAARIQAKLMEELPNRRTELLRLNEVGIQCQDSVKAPDGSLGVRNWLLTELGKHSQFGLLCRISSYKTSASLIKPSIRRV